MPKCSSKYRKSCLAFSVLLLLSGAYYLVLSPLKLSAQTLRPQFRSITLEDGLQQSSVLSLYQDSRGFIWIGTENGLQQYDGYEFKLFSHQPGNINTLSNNRINCITEDGLGHLWVGTDFGLNQLDLKTDSVKQVFFIDSASASIQQQQYKIRQLFYDSLENVLWIGTYGGISLLNLDRQKFNHYQPLLSEGIEPNAGFIRSIYEDQGGTTWVGTQAAGVFYLKKGETIPTPLDLAQKTALDVRSISEDQQGNIWLGTIQQGLIVVDSTGKNLQKIAFPQELKADMAS